MYEVRSGPPPPTVGSWELDHGSTARSATQTGALQPTGPVVPVMGLATSTNIPHAFANAVGSGSMLLLADGRATTTDIHVLKWRLSRLAVPSAP